MTEGIRLELKEIADKFVAAAEDKKITDPKLYCVTGKSILTDYIAVFSVGNTIHCRAVMAEMLATNQKILAEGSDDLFPFPKVSGNIESGWVIIDLNSIVIHVILAELREQYDLDELFEKRAIVYHP